MLFREASEYSSEASSCGGGFISRVSKEESVSHWQHVECFGLGATDLATDLAVATGFEWTEAMVE